MNVCKHFLFFTCIIFSFQQIQSSCFQRSLQRFMHFSENQVTQFIPWLTTHQRRTNAFLTKLSSENQKIANPTVHPEILFSYLLLCQRFKINSNPIFCSWPPNYVTPAKINPEYIQISPLFETFPKSLQYFMLLEIILESSSKFSQKEQNKIRKSAHKCLTCLQIQKIFCHNSNQQPFFIQQMPNANLYCPCHQKDNENFLASLQDTSNQFETEMKNGNHKEASNFLIEIAETDNMKESILDRIPPHMHPDNF